MQSDRPILIEEIWNPSELEDYKVHFARWNQSHQPLDVWVRSRAEWETWQQYRPTGRWLIETDPILQRLAGGMHADAST